MNKYSPKRVAILLFSSYLFVSGNLMQAHAQETVIVNTDLVTMWAQVINRNTSLPSKGLVIEDFLISEAGKPQQLVLVREEQPLSVVLLIKGYAHTWPAEKWYRRLPQTLRTLGDDIEIAVMLYDSTTTLLQPLTKDLNILNDKLKNKGAFHYFLGRHLPERIAEAPPDKIVLSRVGDATYKAAEYLEKTASPTHRKIIIFISDRSFWMDETTMHTGAEVEAYLEQTDTTVYALLHGDKVRVHDHDLLFKLAYRDSIKRSLRGGTIEGFIKATGGSAITGQWEDCDEMFIKLARQIRSSYTIGYYPENTNFDGKFRRIKLELSKSGKAKFGNVDIKTREGYHAIRPQLPNASEKSK